MEDAKRQLDLLAGRWLSPDPYMIDTIAQAEAHGRLIVVRYKSRDVCDLMIADCLIYTPTGYYAGDTDAESQIDRILILPECKEEDHD